MTAKQEGNVKVTVDAETRRLAKLLAGYWNVSIKEAMDRALRQALKQAVADEAGKGE